MPYSAIVVPAAAAIAVARIACAQPERAPVDAARQNERYVIEPGAEPLVAAMLGSGQTLPGGCTLSNGQIDRTAVLATYTCGGGQVVLQLVHPESARPGGVRTRRFDISVNSGTPPDGLVDAVADRVRAREAGFEWKTLGGGAQRTRWVVPVTAVAAAAMLVFWALRRLTRRRRQ